MLGIVGAGIALVAFLIAALLELGGGDAHFIAYVGFAGIAIALFDLTDRRHG